MPEHTATTAEEARRRVYDGWTEDLHNGGSPPTHPEEVKRYMLDLHADAFALAQEVTRQAAIRRIVERLQTWDTVCVQGLLAVVEQGNPNEAINRALLAPPPRDPDEGGRP